MAGDDLMNFPTPAEAFGRGQTNNQRRLSPSQSQNSYGSRHTPTVSNSRAYPNGTPTRLPPQQHVQQMQSSRPPQAVYAQKAVHNVPPLPQTQRVASRQTSMGNMDHSIAGSPSGSFPHQQTQQAYAPQNYYGQQPVPQQQHQQQHVPPPTQQQPQLTAAQVLERQLRDIFDRADRNRDGKLTEEELGTALLNNDGTHFNASTLRLMIRLFDTDYSSTIEFKEFYDLWTYILHWRKAFQRYDVNQNGKISFGEYQTALESFGYRLPTDIVLFVFQKFGDFNSNKPMSLRFDMFVESLIWLLRCTNIFKKFDSQGNGIATIPFQDFVHEFISFI